MQNVAVFVFMHRESTVSFTNMNLKPGLPVDLPEALGKNCPVEAKFTMMKCGMMETVMLTSGASIVGNSTHVPLIDGVLQIRQWR